MDTLGTDITNVVEAPPGTIVDQGADPLVPECKWKHPKVSDLGEEVERGHRRPGGAWDHLTKTGEGHLARVSPFPREERASFDEESHQYTIDVFAAP
eukprot:7371474-Karenia_brevis.AAC.2